VALASFASFERVQGKAPLSRLAWHGALSVDYILDGHGFPLYIDANPRLVEPVNAMLAGVNLADCLVRLSLGRTSPLPEPRAGERTISGLQALIGAAERGAARAISSARPGSSSKGPALMRAALKS
jgi:hypothetical protein